jgi:NAD(P)-dependent dehydrogenase (short-subunit alcohol dehydrogenase family)
MAGMTRKLASKVAVVTGASQDLGEHLAFAFASEVEEHQRASTA